jgi:hypothetical protein
MRLLRVGEIRDGSTRTITLGGPSMEIARLSRPAVLLSRSRAAKRSPRTARPRSSSSRADAGAASSALEAGVLMVDVVGRPVAPAELELARLEWLMVEAKRMPIERLETALESIANVDSDAAARTRAALAESLDRQRKRHAYDEGESHA